MVMHVMTITLYIVHVHFSIFRYSNCYWV